MSTHENEVFLEQRKDEFDEALEKRDVAKAREVIDACERFGFHVEALRFEEALKASVLSDFHRNQMGVIVKALSKEDWSEQ